MIISSVRNGTPLEGFGRTTLDLESSVETWNGVFSLGANWIPRGRGLSYGDASLPGSGVALLVSQDSPPQLLESSSETPLVEVNAGVSVGSLQRWLARFGLELPVVPGSSLVTVGGAIAADIHGKNQHSQGSWGHHVESFELVNPGVARRTIKRDDPAFNVTVGGMGLTGLVTRATLRVRTARSNYVVGQRLSGEGSLRLVAALEDLQAGHEYVVAWLDWTRIPLQRTLRWVVDAANDCEGPATYQSRPNRRLGIPLRPVDPSPRSVRALNAMVFAIAGRRSVFTKSKDAFFFPLERVDGWNRLMGRSGFFEYQFVVPVAAANEVLASIERVCCANDIYPFFSGAKMFGWHQPLGSLSFPSRGLTVAMDFFAGSPRLKSMLDELDSIILGSAGKVYLAKDARLGEEAFKRMYPGYRTLQDFRVSLPNAPSSMMERRLGISR